MLVWMAGLRLGMRMGVRESGWLVRLSVLLALLDMEYCFPQTYLATAYHLRRGRRSDRPMILVRPS